jgi:hypothetical protein
MPDKEIARLTAGATPDGTEIFHGVQGGNSRRFTGAQLVALAADPASDDGDALGTASKRWSDLFLASGGVVNWANGDVTLTHSANALAFAGAASGYSFDAALNVGGSTVALLGTEDQTLAGGARVTVKDLGTISSGTVTPDPGARPHQKYTNNGAHTLAPGTNQGSYWLDIMNGGSAGAIATSGWTKVVGSFTTTNGHKFACVAHISDLGSLLVIQAMQ